MKIRRNRRFFTREGNKKHGLVSLPYGLRNTLQPKKKLTWHGRLAREPPTRPTAQKKKADLDLTRPAHDVTNMGETPIPLI